MSQLTLTGAGPSGSAVNLLKGLVGYWALDEESDGSAPVTRVDSHASFDLTDNNNVPSGVGKVHTYAASFTRTDSPARYLTHAMDAAFQFVDQPFTVAAWFNLASQDAAFPFYSYIFGGIGGPGAGSGWSFFVSGGTLVLACADGSTLVATHASGATAGGWHCGIGWYDPISATVNAVVMDDGTIDTVACTTGVANNAAATLTFGSSSKTLGYKPWDGYIGPCALWNRMLSASERLMFYNAGNGLAYPF